MTSKCHFQSKLFCDYMILFVCASHEAIGKLEIIMKKKARTFSLLPFDQCKRHFIFKDQHLLQCLVVNN